MRFLPPGLAPGLTLTKSGPPSALPGTNITYTITYGNTGGASAANVIIKDPVPAGTTFVSATNGGTNVAGVVTWNIGTLPPGTTGQTVSFTVNVTATSGTITNSSYTIESDTTPPIPGPPVITTVGAGGPTPTPTVTVIPPPATPTPIPQASVAVPTLSTHVLALLAVALAAIAFLVLRRQARPPSSPRRKGTSVAWSLFFCWACVLEAQREAAQAAVHLLEFGHRQHDEPVTALAQVALQARESLGEEDPVVDEDAVGGVLLARRDADEVPAAEGRMRGEGVDDQERLSAEPGDAALQVQEALDPAEVDERRGVPVLREVSRELPRAVVVRARADADEEVVSRLADVAAVDRARRLDAAESGEERGERLLDRGRLALAARSARAASARRRVP